MNQQDARNSSPVKENCAMTVLTLSCICCVFTPGARVTVGLVAIFQQKEVARVMKRHDDYEGILPAALSIC